MDERGVAEHWAECDRCGTCIRDGARREGRFEVLCKDCLALEAEAHALADEVVSTADVSLLREGK